MGADFGTLVTVSTTELRTATLHDLPDIASLLAELGYVEASSNANLIGALESILRDDERRVWVATIAGRVVGMISVSVRVQLRLAGWMLTVEELVVRTSARGAGVGTLLLNAAIEEAKRVGARRVELLMNRTRETYQRGFYTKRGFVEVESAVMRWSPP